MKIRLPYPHTGQQAVRREMRRINVLSAGRRWRKTTLAMALAVEWAMERHSVVWGAPTFDQVSIGWDEAYRAAGGVATFRKSRMEVDFPNGGRVIFRSLDNPDNARGHTASKIIIDEAGDVAEAAWYEVLRPMLMDTAGGAFLIGTPKGRNYFWREWMAAKLRDDSVSWQVPTVGCRIENDALIRAPHPMENPDIPFAEIEQMFRTMPQSTFRQEVLAEFLEGEGIVFRNIAANMIAPHDPPLTAHSVHRVVIGCDWAKQADFSCFSVVCADCMQELALDRFNQIDYIVQRQRLKVLADKWRVRHIEAESNSIGEPIIEQLADEGLPVVAFQTTASSKPPLIESLALALERQDCKWLDIPVATAELEAYERKVSPITGRSQYSAPEGLHDDTVMARALALRAALDIRSGAHSYSSEEY